MPAAIASDGTRNLFATFRQPAWHGLGEVFADEVTDYAVMLERAGLAGWNVHSEEINHRGLRTLVPTFATVGTIGGEDIVFAMSGKRRKDGHVQNEEAFAHIQSLSDGARWETAGALGGGALVFGSIALERETVLDPTGVADVTKTYLLVYTSHDGSTAVCGGATPVRVVCQNTLNAAIPGLTQTFKFRHTPNVSERMAQSAAMWRSTNQYFDGFDLLAQAMMSKPVSDQQYGNLLGRIFPKPERPDVKGAGVKYENKLGMYWQAWRGEPNAGIRGTAWGAWQALTEANQYGRIVQDTDSGQENWFAAGAGFDGPTNDFRADTFARVLSMVNLKAKDVLAPLSA